jgi:hypothetical protein
MILQNWERASVEGRLCKGGVQSREGKGTGQSFPSSEVGQRRSTSHYGFSDSDSFCLIPASYTHKIISSETVFIDYIAFQSTFSSKVFLDYTRLLRGTKRSNSNFMKTNDSHYAKINFLSTQYLP